MAQKIDPMKLAAERARVTMNQNLGGPFGAAVTDRDGNVIAVESNRVLSEQDPTAHAEVRAIREACKKLGTHDLSGCSIYATGYPCPMCLGAIIWSNIDRCYFGCTPDEAASIGFRDEFIYDFIKGDCSDQSVLKLLPADEQGHEECRKLYDEYFGSQKEIY